MTRRGGRGHGHAGKQKQKPGAERETGREMLMGYRLGQTLKELGSPGDELQEIFSLPLLEARSLESWGPQGRAPPMALRKDTSLPFPA